MIDFRLSSISHIIRRRKEMTTKSDAPVSASWMETNLQMKCPTDTCHIYIYINSDKMALSLKE